MMLAELANNVVAETLAGWIRRLTARTPPAPTPPADGPVPNKITKATVADVFAALCKAAPELPRSGVLVLLSQYALETGLGRACHNYNLGNAKHITGDGHKWTMFRCSEIINGHEVFFDPPHPQTWFRAFDTLEEGAADYVAMLRRRFAVAWPAVERGDVASFGHMLKAAHYYTADESAYVRALQTWFDRLNRQLS